MLDRASGRLQKLGGPEAKPSTLLFAKFSPDGSRIGYVRENNIYVENLATGAITQVTTDGSKTLINGTFDWVYEEELDLRDGWRWSPDGQRIAYWQLDTDGVAELRPHQRHRLALFLRDAGAVPEGRRDRTPRRASAW